ncbi:hypothetical protein GGR53DRAFT_529297 [Hypoxylon sp. FL1150]|nr:hypothetical protein GGR53DRAFT_529297 [Hypoxylon sp. FL1150]
MQTMQIEDYPDGYPQLSALIGSDDSFFVCRRFSNLRARLLLLKQDELSVLEEQLNKIDREEERPLRLGSQRSDSGAERKACLALIDEKLSNYDDFVERNNYILKLEDAQPRNVQNLQNWVNGNGNIARAETAYLGRSEDLASVADSDGTVILWLRVMVEAVLFLMRKADIYKGPPNISRDPNVYIPARPVVSQLTRAATALLIIMLLLVPVHLCGMCAFEAYRVSIIAVATVGLLGVLSTSTKARTVELVVAGATYITALAFFTATSWTET